jgi:hypothetical protein
MVVQIHGISGWAAPAGACPGRRANRSRKPNFQPSGYSTGSAAATEAEAEAAARDQAARAARPPGERLLEARCLSCHDRPQIDAQPHGAVMWWATVLRMEWLNGATLHRGERAALVAHLADGRTQRTRMEAFVLAGAGVLLLGFALTARRLGRGALHRRSRS